MKLSRLFTKTEYAIAYRVSEFGLPEDRKTKFTVLKPTKEEWYADPFVIERNGKVYIFMEVFDNQKGYGSIGCSKVNGNTISSPEIVIDDKSHLSFPFLFEKNSKLYMIPESSSQNKIKVFECIDFPYKWIETATLLEGKGYYDSVLFESNGKSYMYTSLPTNDMYGSHLYLFETEKKLQNGFPEFCECITVSDDYHISRQAGANIILNSKNIRVAQDCSENDYGHALMFLEIESLKKDMYSEKEIARIEPQSLHFNEKIAGKAGVHTYNRYKTHDVVDLKLCNFSLKHTVLKFRILFNAIIAKFGGKHEDC